MKKLFAEQADNLKVMTYATDIRPITSPISLSEALEGVQGLDWSLCPDTEQPVSGVSVSSIDIEDNWVFVAIPGLVQHGIRFLHAAIEAGASAVVTDREIAARAIDMFSEIHL